jgi:hypothetical protein
LQRGINYVCGIPLNISASNNISKKFKDFNKLCILYLKLIGVIISVRFVPVKPVRGLLWTKDMTQLQGVPVGVQAGTP